MCVWRGGGGREGVAEGGGQVAKNGLLPSLKKDRKISAFSTCVLGHQAAILNRRLGKLLSFPERSSRGSQGHLSQHTISSNSRMGKTPG